MTDIGFIGAGHMGSVLIKTACCDKNNRVFISDCSADRVSALAASLGATPSTNIDIAKTCKFIFLCVRPQDLETVCEEIRSVLCTRSGFVLVNIAVGISIEYTKKLLDIPSSPVIRMMPNTPIEAGKGVVLYCYENLRSSDENAYKKILAKSCKLYSIPEELMDPDKPCG